MDDWQPTDAELYDAFVGRHRTRDQIAGLSPERVTHMIAYWRKHKVSAEMRDLTLSDEQIAEAVVRYAQSAPFTQEEMASAQQTLATGTALGILSIAIALVTAAAAVWVRSNLDRWGGHALESQFCLSFLGIALLALLGVGFAIRGIEIGRQQRSRSTCLISAAGLGLTIVAGLVYLAYSFAFMLHHDMGPI